MLKKLLKERFEMWCKMRWLKNINKEIKKRNKRYKQYERHEFVVSQLVKEYNKIYSKEGADNG